MGWSFQVTDVRKPLLAVKRITEKGNVVQFGPAENDNYVYKKQTVWEEDPANEKMGSYIIDLPCRKIVRI